MSTPTKPTQTLATFAATLPADQVPAEVLSLLPTLLLDATATLLAGTAQPVYGMATEALLAATGGGQTEALGGALLPFSTAVLLTGIAAADFEFEHVIQNAHPASSVLPALLPLAAERHCTGPELLAAMAVGYELAARLGAASTAKVESERGFHNPGLNGTVACAAACARLLKLDANQTANAIGIAASSSAGLLAFVNTGAMTKRLHPARSAQLGLESALLAQAGVTGPNNVLENPLGFLHAFSPTPDLNALTDGLGQKWISTQQILKLAPVHAYAQLLAYAIGTYRGEVPAWTVQDVGDVQVSAGPAVLNPSHMDTQPTSLVAAQYSIPFSLALALGRDLRDPLQVNDAAVRDADLQALAKRIQFKQTTNDPKDLGGSLTFTLRGQSVTLPAETFPGLPGHDGYAEAAHQKLTQVLAALHLSEHLDSLSQAVAGLGALSDAASFWQLLVQVAHPK